MPQITQLADVALSQLFWLLLTLAVIYFGIGRAVLPKVMATMEARESRIAADLAAAEAARRNADETEEAYRARMDASRADALKVLTEARQASARASEQRLAEADKVTRARIEAAEARLRGAADASVTEIEAVAAEAAQEMTVEPARVSVSREEAAQAVKAVLAHG